jgi:hypothetical protein
MFGQVAVQDQFGKKGVAKKACKDRKNIIVSSKNVYKAV